MAPSDTGVRSGDDINNSEVPLDVSAWASSAEFAMSIYWLCYHHNNQISVVIEPGASLIHARMRAALANLDQGEFTEGHELDRKTTKQAPKAMIGRRLSQTEAKRLLAKFE
jgi:hypothetical protein